VNPVTGLGLTNRIQDTVIGPNATTTDGLDTTVNVLGVERGLKLVDSLPHTAALILTEDAGVKKSFRSKKFERFSHGAVAP
jgi:thiamine biosynthesis lipoprotein